MFNEEFKKEMTEGLINVIQEHYLVEKMDDGFHKYHVPLQDVTFETFMSDEELEKACEYTFNVMKELHEINESGITKEKLWEIEKNIRNNTTFDDKPAMSLLMIVKEFATDKLNSLLNEITEFRRTGGAYAMLIARPLLVNVVYSVYGVIADNFSDEDLLIQCCYFLLRGIMKVGSNDLNEEDDDDEDDE